MYIWRHSNIWTPIPIKGGTLACSFSHLSLAMLLMLFVYYIIQWASIDAGPIPSVNDRSPAPNHCTDLSHCRSVWNIIWSCLVTIFSCTWVAVHPNIPCPKKRKTNGWIDRCILNPIISFAKCRLTLFVCALLVPEYVLAWAIRQFLSARKIFKENESEYKTLVIFLPIAVIPTNPLLDRGWSMTHGFFVIMGGFHLFERMNNDDRGISPEDGEPLHPLEASNLRDYCGSFIMLTEAEIMDKGKSDWVAKSLVLLQTSWFVMQCIARAMRHLPVTHLEIITLAYAAMNFVIFILWWKKPRNVHRPIRVFQRSSSGETQPITETRLVVAEETQPVTEEIRPVAEETQPIAEETRPVTEEARLVTAEETQPVTEETRPVTEETQPITEERRSVTAEETQPITEEARLVTAEETQPVTKETQPQVTERTSEVTWKAIGNGLSMVRFIVGLQDQGVNLSHEDSVPMFWANSTDGNELIFADFMVLWVGVCFGAIHCIAWHFSFPTHAELLMWQISSIAITALPIYIPLMFGLAGLLGGLLGLEKFANIVFYSSPVIGGILYIIARAVTLVLAFTSLRDLLPGAYETVHWTTFIPHI